MCHRLSLFCRLSMSMVLTTALSAADRYVATTGNDSNPGTLALPYATIGRAAAVAQAGDTVWIRGGTYRPSEQIKPAASGTPTAPIAYRAMPGETPVIDGQGRVPGFDWEGIITTNEKSHLIFEGLTIINSRWGGIWIIGGANVTIRGCSTDRTNSSGIYLVRTTTVRVTENRVRRACILPIFDPNKGSQECITLNGVVGFEVDRNVVHDRMVDVSWGGEGIDVKGRSSNGTIHHNEVFDLIRLGIYVDAYGNEISNISIYGNTVRNTKHGIVVANERNQGMVQDIRVHDNLVLDAPARGISIAGYDGNGPIRNVSIYNNTIINSGRNGGWEGAGLVIQADNALNSGFVVRNNLLSGNTNGIVSRSQSYLTLDRNLIFGTTTETGTNALRADPRFVDAANNDYRLAAGSPAIDAARGTPVSTRDFDDRQRPVDGDGDGTAIADIGAFERPSGILPTGWSSQDIGSVAAAGSASHASGTWTISGSGADIWEAADHFRFAYRTWTGDVRITARITTQTATDPWAKSGVMVRDGLTAGARHGMTALTPTRGSFQRRPTADATSVQTLVNGPAAPYWVRLERRGDVLRGSISSDGQTWQQIDATTIALPAVVQVGLAVTSHDDGTLGTATFTHVEIVAPPADGGDTTPPATPAAPSASSLTSATPVLSGTTEANATVRIRNNGTLIATVAANASGAWSWTVGPALAVGSNALTVTATDTAGNTSNPSPATTVTVGPDNTAPSFTAPASASQPALALP